MSPTATSNLMTPASSRNLMPPAISRGHGHCPLLPQRSTSRQTSALYFIASRNGSEFLGRYDLCDAAGPADVVVLPTEAGNLRILDGGDVLVRVTRKRRADSTGRPYSHDIS